MQVPAPFVAPPWAPTVNDADIPDHFSLLNFVFDDDYRPFKSNESPAPFIDGISGLAYTVLETRQRIEWLAAGLASQLGIDCAHGSALDRVISIFAVNNVSDSSPRTKKNW